MYSTKKAILLLCLAIVAQFGLFSTATAAYLVGNDVEVLETVLAYVGMLSLGILGTCLAFIRWFLKRWNPRQLDPETLIMVTKMMNDPGLGPVLKDRDDMQRAITEHDKTLKKVVDTLGKLLAAQKVKPDWDKEGLDESW